ncbi:unnamed protein product [Rotaria sp. Silwood1]|nr:unnamed protein product [Rotaria sp. Silwood1]CAF0996380.1 unnamed protein product [Rotaria sp. Silwood1]CAF3384689.1 unnamed protein product [Rotaria sp. Silwood1]CAF3428489.1 unnamed protein product [Rotaria sp. Silwood1]CAF4531139.1 unnamed protein product [Rotaria sp. Silwood1]
MVRLTPEIIEVAPQYLNPVGQYELCLRDLKISVIENLGVTLNQFDTIDFTNNDLRKLDGFPFLPKLKTIYLANNHITRIAENLQQYIPNLDTLMLNNNLLQELTDIDPLATLPKLTHVSFVRSPIAMKKDYRLYVIHRLPNLRTLDFNQITQKEREAARKLYKSKSSEKLKKQQKGDNTFVPGEELAKQQQQKTPRLTKKNADAIKKAISEAKSLEEVERLKAMLQSGQMPGLVNQHNDNSMEQGNTYEQNATVVHVADLAHARAQELQSLLYELGHRQDKHRTALQILPRYMRRRAASYNIKRLPRSLRPLADPKTGTAKTKRPSRCYRRRPRNLLSSYTNRQRKVKWLKTHIWHAKRFHMNTLWNYRLAEKSNTKCIRPTYKSLRERCLLHDMSYYGCIQLEGNEDEIIEKMNPLFPSSSHNLTPKAKMYLGGQFEGQCFVYKPNTQECLTPISFMWMPSTDKRRKLWIWCHPASYNTLANILISLFDTSSFISTEEPPVKKQKNDEQQQQTVAVTLLRDQQQLARFRLIGPLSMAILKHAFHPSVLPSDAIERKTAPFSWWSNEAHSTDIYQQQLQFWNSNISNTSTMMPNRVVALVVRDPRIFTPIKPKLTIHSKTKVEKIESFPPSSIDLASSPLWIEKYRTYCCEHKLATYQINLIRSKSTVDNNELQLNEEESQIPLIFIHHHDLLSSISKHKQYRNDFGSGWDIILPNEWAQIFWISLVYSGARPIGQKELSLISHETGEFQFPQEYPDTDAGIEWASKIEAEQLTYFSKCPPSKRPNFFLNGIASPFRPLWSNIVHDWTVEYDPSSTVINSHRFYVLRDRHRLSLDNLRQHLHSLVPIRISIKGRKGIIDNTTLIYLPTMDDLKDNKKTIVESRHCDRARIEERKMKKAKQSYQKGKTMVKLIEQRANNSKQAIIHDCDRKLLGAITSGAFQFSKACCTGKGFIAMGGLLTLLQQQQQQKNAKKQFQRVLIRTIKSQYYRWASLEF